jgi:arabinogalactan oligomer/maltooligosaccharide transport system substrate-binding protein
MNQRWVIVLGLVVTACSGNKNNSGGPDMAKASLSGSLTIWNAYHSGGSEQTALGQVLKSVQTANPKLTVNNVNIDFSQVFTSWAQQITTGTGPDMFTVPNDSLGDMVRKNQVADLTALLSGKLTGINQLAVQGLTYGSKIYGVPVVVKAVALFYNKSTIPTPPKTLDELKVLVASGKKLVMAENAYNAFGLWGAFGGQVMDASGKCIATQNAGVQNALQYLLDLQNAGAVFNPDGNATDSAFEMGNADMIINGPWILGDYKTALGTNLGVVPLPMGSAAPSPLVGIDGWFVNPNSPNKELAVELALQLTAASAQQVYATVAGDPPVRSDVTISDPLVSTFQNLSGTIRPQSTQFDNYWGPFGNAVTNVLAKTNAMAPADAVTAACTAMNMANGF